MHARYYSFHTARFLSVDPVKGEVGSSQSWNRYSYVINNPMRFIDPLGLTIVEIIDGLYIDEISVTAEDPGGDGEGSPTTLPDTPVWDRVASDFAALAAYKGDQSRPNSPSRQDPAFLQVMASVVPGAVTPRERRRIEPFEMAYDNWFKNPTLALGQQHGAKFWGPVGNCIYCVTRGRAGSSCTGWALGLFGTLRPLNTDQTRAVLTQRWFPIPHTYVSIQARRRDSWVTVRRFDPFWRIR